MATTKPAAKKAAKPAAKPAPKVEATEAESVFGVADVAELIKVETGKVVKPRDLRVLLRKMARDGRLDREIVAGNRDRWVFEGPEDPEVEAIIEAYNAGELDADKKEKLDALKAKKAADRAAKKEAEAEESDEDDDEVIEDDEDDSDDDE